MSALYWEIHWKFGLYPLDRDTKKATEQVIKEYLLRSDKWLEANDIGLILDGLSVPMQGAPAPFAARLARIEPLTGCKVDLWTNIHAINPVGTGKGGSVAPAPVSDEEIDNFILWKTTFDHISPDTHYLNLYNSLVGTEKELILEEMISLLAPINVLHAWSQHFYPKQELPILRTVANKAPLLIFGGDPGTGKTALATSIGAALSHKLQERVHFRHMSLSLRGMGYQGRASTLIVKTFESINQEYMKRQEPMIVFFDEAEAVVGSREQSDTSSGSQQDIAIVDAIIVGIDSLRKGIQSRIVVIFATNIIGHIDTALMRRGFYHNFQRPNDEARRQLLEFSLQGMGFSEQDFNVLVKATRPKEFHGKLLHFTHSDIVELIIARAINRAVRMKQPLKLELLLDFCSKANPTRPLANPKVNPYE